MGRVRGALPLIVADANVLVRFVVADDVDQADRVARALDWLEAGLDFADALHLAASAEGDTFVTFDQGLLRRTARLGVTIPVRAP